MVCHFAACGRPPVADELRGRTRKSGMRPAARVTSDELPAIKRSTCKHGSVRSRPRPYVSGDQAIILDATANHIEKVLDHYSDFGFATDWGPAAGCPLHSEGDRLKRQYGPGTTHTERRWTGTELLTRTVPVARYWD